jgi:hypothetical protein
MEDTKECYTCNKVKSLEEFNKWKKGRFGRKNVCRECQKSYRHEWYLKNAESEKEKVSEYNKDPEIRRRFREKYKNDEQLRNKLCESNNKRRRTPEARSKARIQRAKWYSIPHNRIAQTLRCRIRLAIKGKVKPKSTESLLGCTFEEAKLYIEKLFKSGMSWDNYGEWHIDHIIPCASFDLTKIDEQNKCFHYTNLQPLWKLENISKGAKLLYLELKVSEPSMLPNIF